MHDGLRAHMGYFAYVRTGGHIYTAGLLHAHGFHLGMAPQPASLARDPPSPTGVGRLIRQGTSPMKLAVQLSKSINRVGVTVVKEY